MAAFDSNILLKDFGFLPPTEHSDIQIFISDNVVTTSGFQHWIKPRTATMCYMIAVSGGGGGGGGRTRTSTNPGGGGGGGCSGNIGKLIIPAMLIPDNLSIMVGQGGAGGAANTAGTIGTDSTIGYGVGLTALRTIPNVILFSASNNQTAAGAGAVGGAGAGGIVGATPSAANIGATQGLGIVSFIGGQNGSAGGVQTGAVGADVTAIWNLVALSGGAGGAGVNTVNTGFAGGNITLQAAMDLPDSAVSPASSIIAGGTAGGVGAAGSGSAGIQLYQPFYGTGGSGGGSSDKSTGGNGGQGAIGCGGGGGGAGTTGGTGGRGGDGIVIIISW